VESMDPLRHCIAFGPVAVYLALIGGVNLLRRPFVVSGARDLAALAIALSGLIVVGPVELFFPDHAAVKLGWVVWLILLGLYLSAIVFIVLSLRPRLVIYNVTTDRLRPVLGRLIEKLDKTARWAGDCVIMPDLGIQFYIDNSPAMRNMSLKSAGPNQDLLGWRKLESELLEEIKEIPSSRNPRGLSMLAASLIVAGWIVYVVLSSDVNLVQSLKELLRIS